jgi:hypothetical protein
MAKIALLIGVSNYDSQDLKPLPAAARDVAAMQEVLQNPDLGEFDRVAVLPDPDLGQIQDAINSLFDDCQTDDLVLLYFSGHGITDEAGNFFFTNRTTRKTKQGRLNKGSATPASFVHDLMENCESDRLVIVLDCCHSGAFPTGMTARDAGMIDFSRQLGGKGRIILTSSAATEYSFERQGEELAVYTRYLVEGIRTGAADLDGDGAISVNELHDYVREQVRKAAPAMKPERYVFQEGEKILLAKSLGNPLKKRIAETICIREPQKEKLNMEKVNVFISFAQEDIKMLEQLEGHLTLLNNINIWHKGKIIAGSNQRDVIDNQINIAKLILLLISSKFTNSADCKHDQNISLERRQKGEVIVIPILLKPLHLEGNLIENLKCLPETRKYISDFPNKDKAFTEVVKGVSTAIQSIQDEN